MEVAMESKNSPRLILPLLLLLLLISLPSLSASAGNNNNEKKKKHFVLIHGGSHGAWCWYKVATLLRSKGHNVTTLDLAASGINPKQVNQIHFISDYYEPLMSFMASVPATEKVILVGHSLGGVSTSVAMEKFPHKISVAVFATAYVPVWEAIFSNYVSRDKTILKSVKAISKFIKTILKSVKPSRNSQNASKSAKSIFPTEFPNKHVLGQNLSYPALLSEINRRNISLMDTQFFFGDGPTKPPTARLIGPKFMATHMYQLSPPEDLTLALSLVRPVPIYNDAALLKKETDVTSNISGRVPKIFIISKNDDLITEDLQNWMIQRSLPFDDIKVIKGSDHMIMFSQPLKLTSHLLQIANKY